MHVLTATGAALGVLALFYIFDGYYKEALWILALAVLIDSFDGFLARKLDVKNRASAIDGALMDNIIDFLNWTVAPLFWAYALMEVPLWVMLICAVASILGFSNIHAKTEDHYFQGFPSYWNIVVFYLFLLDLPVEAATGIMLAFAVLTLVPVKFIYPTRTPHLQILTVILGIVYFIQMVLLLYLFDQSPAILIYSSLLFPVYYFGFSFYLNLQET